MDPLKSHDPQRIGPYRLVGRLGEGGMGVVFAALQGDVRVAVKVIRPEYASDAQFRARFGRETALMSRVSGPCTAEVLGYDVQAEQPWLATRYVPGPTLQEHVTGHGPLPPAGLRALAAGLAEALRAMHRAGVVHRDLKPSNVILSPHGPVVIDFGIAVTAEGTAITRTHQVVGSPGWISPEQYRGVSADASADVFCLGGVLLYAATGRAPFGGGTAEVVAHRVLTASPDLSPLPPELRHIAERSLSKDPARRPTSTELAAALTRIGTVATGWAEVAAALPQQPPWPHPSRPTRHPLLLALAATVAATGLAVAIIVKLDAGTPGKGGATASGTPLARTLPGSSVARTAGGPAVTTTWASLAISGNGGLLFKPEVLIGHIDQGTALEPNLRPVSGAVYQTIDLAPDAKIRCAFECYGPPDDGGVHIDHNDMGTIDLSGSINDLKSMITQQGSYPTGSISAEITYTLEADGTPIISRIVETYLS